MDQKLKIENVRKNLNHKEIGWKIFDGKQKESLEVWTVSIFELNWPSGNIAYNTSNQLGHFVCSLDIFYDCSWNALIIRTTSGIIELVAGTFLFPHVDRIFNNFPWKNVSYLVSQIILQRSLGTYAWSEYNVKLLIECG